MVIVRVANGMGNQMFQYALARDIANKLHTELKIDLTDCNKNKDSHHIYYKLGAFNIQENFATPEDLNNINAEEWKILDTGLKPLKPGDNVYISGAWMLLEHFFKDASDILRREFTLKNPLSKISDSWRHKIMSAECAVSVHIRLNDYLLPHIRKTNWGRMLSFDYYAKCIAELKKFVPAMTLFVFSDDIDWAKENFKFDVPMEYVEGCEHDFEEMHLISLCKHNILCVSTFGMWGAWLNNNHDKKIFAPSYCVQMSGCIAVNVDNSKHPLIKIAPTLSVIIYIEDYSYKEHLLLSSIFNRMVDDCEIIILDAGTGLGKNIDKKLLIGDNVSLIRIDSDMGKAAAWNRGIDCANGYYVMLLSTGDFIVANIFELLQKAVNDCFRKNTPKKWHITHGAYEQMYIDKAADIFCSAYILNEIPNGDIKVKGIPNRDFKAFVDSFYKDKKTTSDIKIDDRQKLISLASGQINNLLGTKFFNRKFLNKHRIRFDEHKQGGVLS